MKCDELKVHKAYNRWIDEEMPTPNDDLICNEVYLKSDVDASIAELKEVAEDACLERDDNQNAIDELQAEHHKERHEYIKMIAELKAKLEDAKATAYAESVDAGMENRRLKRALWLARAECCYRLDVDRYLRKHRNSWYNENCLTWAEACEAMEVKMCKAESKCLAKAEEYK